MRSFVPAVSRAIFLALALSLLAPSLGGAIVMDEKARPAAGALGFTPLLAAAPAGLAGMAVLTNAVADQALAGPRIAEIFDAAQDRAASTAGEPADEKAPSALLEKHEKAVAARLEAFNAAVEKIKSGPYGVALQWELAGDDFHYDSKYTIAGQILEESQIEAKVGAGELPKAEWETARGQLTAALPGLLEKLVDMLRKNEADLQTLRRKEKLARGQELQSWAVPISISIDRNTALRYMRLYRLGGMPTDLGDALHGLLAPLVAADPKFLSRLTTVQLHEAVQSLNESLRYSLDMRSPDAQERARLGGPSEDYDYPEVRQTLVDFARKKLLEPPLPEDKSAGLGMVPPQRRPSLVLARIFHDVMTDERSKTRSGGDVSGITPLLRSLHAALGVPMKTSQGPMLLTIRHRQLLPLVAELRRRNAHDDVVDAVIRAFPLGESILRLGAHRLWERGLTGKGVKIAVIDNGVDFGHPDFSDVENPIQENFTRDRGPHTKGAHGTPMASIIHAIAPDAEIQSYQALSNTSKLAGVALSEQELNAAIVKAMDRARENGAQIINMSLGNQMGYANDALAEKVSELAKEGIVVVVSAGNEGYDLREGYQVRSPASSPDAIAVGAVNYHGEVHGNKEAFGSQGIVFNPDKNTVAEKPEIWAYGVNVKAAQRLSASEYREELVPYDDGSGTSPAAPHVSSVVALMLQAAREAGQAVAKPSITEFVRRSLVAAAAHVDRRPVMDSAEKSVDAYLAAAR